MFPLVAPPLAKYGVIAAVIAGLCVVSYVAGRKHVRAQWEAERAKIAAVAATQEVENERTENLWLKRMNGAEILYGKRMLVVTANAEREYQRLRLAASGSSDMPGAADAAASGDGCPRCPTRAELLGIGEDLVRVAGAADTERAGLIACAAAWPTNNREQ